MKIVWLPLALTDLAKIDSYYTEVASKTVANRQLKKIVKSVKLLQTQPYMGHPSPNEIDIGILEWNIPSTTFALPYYIEEDKKEIRFLRVFDQRQERPDSWIQ